MAFSVSPRREYRSPTVLVTVRSLASFLRTFSYSEMAFCSLPCWTYFSALANTFCLLKPNNAIRASNSRPWSSPKTFDTEPDASRGKLLRSTGREGHPQYRQMADRTRPIVRPDRGEGMVTKGYQKGVYRRCRRWVSASRSSRGVLNHLLGFRKHRAEVILHILFVHHAVVNRSDPSLAIDQEGIRHVFDAIRLGPAIVAENDLIRHVGGLDEGSYRFPAVGIQRNSDHRETLAGVLVRELREPGNFQLASVTPCGPEIKQDHFAAIVS